MAVDRSDFIAAGASLNTNFATFWPNLENCIKQLASLYVGKKTHGSIPNDILNGIYLGDDTLTTERNWRIFSDSTGKFNIDRNTGSDASPVWSNRLQMDTSGGFVADVNVKTGANIARAKLAAGATNRLVVNDGSGVMTDAAAVTGNRVLLSNSSGIPVANAALSNNQVLRTDGSGFPSSVTAMTTGRVAITDTTELLLASAMTSAQATSISASTTAELDRIPGTRLRITFSEGFTATTGLVWTNMPVAETFFNGSSAYVQKADLTKYTQVRFTVMKLGVAGSTNAVLRLRYRATYDATPTNWNALGTSDVALQVNGTTAFLDTGYINLAAGAKADVLVCLTGAGGDAVADPTFGAIVAEFR